MEDLTPAEELFNEDFRLVPAPAVQCQLPSEVSSERTASNKVQSLLSISSRYGYAFVAIRNSIFVYTTDSLYSKNDGKPVSTTLLEPNEFVLSLELLFQDRLLLVHVCRNAGDIDGCMLAFDSLKLVDGVRLELSSLNGTACSSFAAFDSETPLVSIVTPEKGVRTFNVTDSCREIWSKPDDTTSSEAPICLSFSDDGKELAICTRRGSVQILDSLTGTRKSTLKEIESGWTPVSVAYVTRNSMKRTNSSEVLVSYQKESLVCCVIWLLTNGTIVRNTCFEVLFFPDIDAIRDGNMHTFCLPIEDWDIAVLANSCSCDVKLIALVDENWVSLTLDEGKEFQFPLNEGDQSYPLGFALDYSDTRTVPSADDRENRNPMPRFVTLTSAEQLWSAWIIDDKDDAACKSVQEKKPTSTVDPLPLDPPVYVRSTSSLNLHRGGEPKSHSSATESEAESDVNLLSGNTFSSFAAGESFGFGSAAMNRIPEAPKAQTSAFENMREMGSSFGITSTSEQAENKELSHNTHRQWGMFSSFGLEGSETGATDRNIPKRSASSTAIIPSDALKPDMSESINLAKYTNPINQVKSILTGMEREIKHVRAHKDEAERCVELSRPELERSVGELKTLLRNLLDLDTDYWKREKNSRVLVNGHLKAIIEVGQKFEEMNLLNALLTENDDARPLPVEAQDEDRALNKKESAIADRLDEVERKIESRSPDTKTSRLGISSKAETSQHVYSSISLQAIRITRIRAVLVSLENQLRYVMEEDENRVANSGLARSRLERLSKYTNGESASSARAIRVLSSPNSRSMHTLQESVRKLNVSSVGPSCFTSELDKNLASSVFEPPVIRGNAAITLRKLAMRKGRERITTPEKIVVTNTEASDDRAEEATLIHVPEVATAPTLNPTPSFGATSLLGAKADPSQFKIHLTGTQSAASFGSSTPKRSFGSFNPSGSIPVKQVSSSNLLASSTLLASASPPAPSAPQPPPTSSAPAVRHALSAAPVQVVQPASPPSPAAIENDFSVSPRDVTTSPIPFAAMPPEPTNEPVPAPPEIGSQKTELPPTPPETPSESNRSLSPEPAVANTRTPPHTPPPSNKEHSQLPAPQVSSSLLPPAVSSSEADTEASPPSEPNGKPKVISNLASGASSLVDTAVGPRASDATSSAVTANTKSVGFGASLSGVQSGSLFGSSSTSQGFGFGGNGPMTQSAFGTTEQSQSGLGSSNEQDANKSSFASSESQSAFGFFGSSQSQGGFGAGSSQGGFGANSTTNTFSSQSMFGTQSAFGMQPNPGAFTASSSSLFDQSNSSSGFGGGGSGGAFGSGAPSSFASVPNVTFGATSSFGMAANPTPSFGAPSSFGVNSNPTGFGASLSGVQSSSLFASSTPPRSFGGFGGSGTPQGKQSPFAQLSNSGNGFGGSGTGSSQQSPFGQMGVNQVGFGGGSQGGSLFGQTGNNGGFGGGNGFGGGGFGQPQEQQSQSNMYRSDAFTKRRA